MGPSQLQSVLLPVYGLTQCSSLGSDEKEASRCKTQCRKSSTSKKTSAQNSKKAPKHGATSKRNTAYSEQHKMKRNFGCGGCLKCNDEQVSVLNQKFSRREHAVGQHSKKNSHQHSAHKSTHTCKSTCTRKCSMARPKHCKPRIPTTPAAKASLKPVCKPIPMLLAPSFSSLSEVRLTAASSCSSTFAFSCDPGPFDCLPPPRVEQVESSSVVSESSDALSQTYSPSASTKSSSFWPPLPPPAGPPKPKSEKPKSEIPKTGTTGICGPPPKLPKSEGPYGTLCGGLGKTNNNQAGMRALQKAKEQELAKLAAEKARNKI